MSFFGKSGPSPEEMAIANQVKLHITENLKQAIKMLQRTHIDSDEPIRSEDSANAVCSVLEAIFLHNLKSWPSNKSFWAVLSKVSHRDVLSQLNHLGQITTEIGMCRAWIRLALNDGVMESYIEALSADQSTLRQYYRALAYLRDEEQRDILKSFVQSLCYFTFQLSYNSSVLNMWTPSPLVLAGLMRAAQEFPQPTIQSEAPSVITTRSVPPPGNRSGSTGSRVAPSSQPSLQHPGEMAPDPSRAAELTSRDIEEIRHMTAVRSRTSDTASTDTSHVSQPDFTDARDMHQLQSALLQDLEEIRFQAIIADTVPIRTEQDMLPRQAVDQAPGKGKQNAGRHGTKGGKSEMSPGKEKLSAATADRDSHRTPSPKPGNVADRTQAVNTPKPDTIKSLFPEVPQQPATGPPPAADTATSTSQPPEQATAASIANLFPVKKSPPLAPELSSAVVSSGDIEIAAEVFSSRPEETLADTTAGDPDTDMVTPGNSLGVLQGWSSDFEPDRILPDVPLEHELLLSEEETNRMLSTADESFDHLLHSYTAQSAPMDKTSMSDVLGSLHTGQEGHPAAPEQPLPPVPTQQPSPPRRAGRKLPMEVSVSTADSVDLSDEYEVLPDLVPGDKSYLSDSKFVPLLEMVGDLGNERGLDMQNYQCKTCARAVGMFYGKARVCSYDGGYYCYECHENEEYYIPSRIVYNWDFRKHQVSRRNFEFLRLVEEEPLLNIQKLNPSLYQHVPELGHIHELRQQLRYLKAYLFTCKQSVADDLRRQVWPREYLFDDIHVYSLTDLLQVTPGQLAASIHKVLKFASKHVYDCRLCSLKGFVCEICQNTKVIYPFQMDTTSRCEKCKSVYHKQCKTDLVPCPKCERRRVRLSSTSSAPGSGPPLTPDAADYTYPG